MVRGLVRSATKTNEVMAVTTSKEVSLGIQKLLDCNEWCEIQQAKDSCIRFSTLSFLTAAGPGNVKQQPHR